MRDSIKMTIEKRKMENVRKKQRATMTPTITMSQVGKGNKVVKAAEENSQSQYLS